MALPGVRRVSAKMGPWMGTHYNRIGARQGTDGFMDQGGVSVFTV